MRLARSVWGGLLAAGLAFEVYTLFNRRHGDTLSEVVWSLTDQTPLIPLVIGIICGHWFWPRKQ